MYERRTDVEIDIRNLNVVLGTENIRAQSCDMFIKILLTSQVAYNLVIQFRRQAASLAKLPPRRLSYKRLWTTFRVFLLSSMTGDAAHCRERYRLALHHAQRDKLPNRPDRHYAREAYKDAPNTTTTIPENPLATPQRQR